MRETEGGWFCSGTSRESIVRLIMATEATKTTIEVVAAVTLAVIMQLAATAQCHKLEWGPCLVHYLEPCSSDVIQFYLFSSDRPHELLPPLDPIMPDVPHWVNMSHPLKLIIHGYGGYADYNATRAIRSGESDVTVSHILFEFVATTEDRSAVDAFLFKLQLLFIFIGCHFFMRILWSVFPS